MKGFARVLLCTAVATLLTAATGYQVNYGTNQNITEWSTCKNVANNSPTGKAIFVPTNTGTEWAAFYNASTPGVTVTNCGCTVTAGSQSYTTAGSFTFTVPCHNTLTVQVWGGGGGGSGRTASTSIQGGTGGTSSWNGTVIATGGEGGKGTGSTTGYGGVASGGSTNINGTAGDDNSGGASPNGGAGGQGGKCPGGNDGKAGNAPGGGGGGMASKFNTRPCTEYYGGGGGAYSSITYASGTFTPLATVSVVVGAGGAKGDGATKDGGPGAVGRVTITWN